MTNKATKRNIPELLSPAGGTEQLKAAVENGADAVYMGGKLFNARINAENFSDDEMKEAIAYAHVKGVKLYITMNTLLYDDELNPALSFAAQMYDWGADALILQNLGFASLLRKYLPQMPLHLSTQATVYNLEGVKMAARLGFSRIVLARELSLCEIKAIAQEKLADLEIFIHGALCMCYSGQCQMSNEIGGRSGNRGQCAQPCRLPYQLCREWPQSNQRQEKPSITQPFSEKYFALSPKDLCTVEHLGKLAEAGVRSLKIEGRMKSAEYVAIVTGIYRHYLDEYAQKGSYDVAAEDIRDLNQIFNRGGFTRGYLLGNPGKDFLSGHLPKHQGIYLGKVKGVSPKRGLIDVDLARPVAFGDGVEIHNQDLPGNVVTYLKYQTERLVTIGDIYGSVHVGDEVYKITDQSLMERAKRSYEGKSWQDRKQLRKIEVSASFSAACGQAAVLTLTDQDGNVVQCQSNVKAQKAEHKSLNEEMIIRQLKKTGGTPFDILTVAIKAEEGLSLPIAALNQLRRETLSLLEERRARPEAMREKHMGTPDSLEWKEENGSRKYEELKNMTRSQLFSKAHNTQKNTKKHSLVRKPRRALYLFEGNDLPQYEEYCKDKENKFEIIYLPYDVFLEEIWDNLKKASAQWEKYRTFRDYAKTMKQYTDAGIRLIPVIPNVTKGKDDHLLLRHLDALIEVARNSGIMIGTMSWIDPFVKAGVEVYGDYALNLSNSLDFLLMSKWGLKGAVLSQEIPLEQIGQMEFHGLEIELTVGGQIPVMTTEHCILSDHQLCGRCETDRFYLQDRKGKIFRIISNGRKCKNVIISYKINKLETKQEQLMENYINAIRIYGA